MDAAREAKRLWSGEQQKYDAMGPEDYLQTLLSDLRALYDQYTGEEKEVMDNLVRALGPHLGLDEEILGSAKLFGGEVFSSGQMRVQLTEERDQAQRDYDEVNRMRTRAVERSGGDLTRDYTKAYKDRDIKALQGPRGLTNRSLALKDRLDAAEAALTAEIANPTPDPPVVERTIETPRRTELNLTRIIGGLAVIVVMVAFASSGEDSKELIDGLNPGDRAVSVLTETQEEMRNLLQTTTIAGNLGYELADNPNDPDTEKTPVLKGYPVFIRNQTSGEDYPMSYRGYKTQVRFIKGTPGQPSGGEFTKAETKKIYQASKDSFEGVMNEFEASNVIWLPEMGDMFLESTSDSGEDLPFRQQVGKTEVVMPFELGDRIYFYSDMYEDANAAKKAFEGRMEERLKELRPKNPGKDDDVLLQGIPKQDFDHLPDGIRDATPPYKYSGEEIDLPVVKPKRQQKKEELTWDKQVSDTLWKIIRPFYLTRDTWKRFRGGESDAELKFLAELALKIVPGLAYAFYRIHDEIETSAVNVSRRPYPKLIGAGLVLLQLIPGLVQFFHWRSADNLEDSANKAASMTNAGYAWETFAAVPESITSTIMWYGILAFISTIVASIATGVTTQVAYPVLRERMSRRGPSPKRAPPPKRPLVKAKLPSQADIMSALRASNGDVKAAAKMLSSFSF